MYVLCTLSPLIAIGHILSGRGIYSTHYLAHILIRRTFLTTYSYKHLLTRLMVIDKTRQLLIGLHGTVKAHLQCTSGTLVLVSGLRSDTFSADCMKISSHCLSTGRLPPCNLSGSLKEHTNTTQCHHVE